MANWNTELSDASETAASAITGKPYQGILPTSLALWVVGFFIGLYMIRPWEILIPELGHIHFERIYLIASILIVSMSGGIRVGSDGQTLALLGFVASLVVSMTTGYDFTVSWQALYSYGTIVLSYFLMRSVTKDSYSLVFLITCYVGFMGMYLAKALTEFYVFGARTYSQGVVRLVGIESSYGGSNAVAASTVIVLPFAYFLWKCRREITIGWSRNATTVFRYCLLIYFVISAWAVILTNSRTGFICLILFFVLTQWRKSLKFFTPLLTSAILIFVAWHFLPDEHKERFRTIWDPSAGPANARESAEGRKEGLRAGLQTFQDFPVFGVGPGNFPGYRRDQIDGVNLNAHNLVGQILAETGAVGTLLFSLFVLAIFLNTRVIRALLIDVQEPEAIVLVRIARAIWESMLILGVTSLTGHTLYRYNWIWTAGFAALAAQFAHQLRQSEDHSDLISNS